MKLAVKIQMTVIQGILIIQLFYYLRFWTKLFHFILLKDRKAKIFKRFATAKLQRQNMTSQKFCFTIEPGT